MDAPSDPKLQTSYRTCPLCEATCGLEIQHDGERVLRIRGDREDVFSKGFICPKGAAFGELNRDPDRLREPMIRGADGWRTVGWDEAFAEVAAGFEAVISAHGRQAVAAYLGNPSAHNLSSTVYSRVFLKSIGTRNLFTASTVDQMPKHVSSGMMFGSPLMIPIPDVDRTDYLLMLGANPWVSNGSLATAPDWPGRLRALRKRGGRFVVVDPVRTQTADHADEHVPLRPGADGWFLAAMINTLFEEDRVQLGRLETFTDGVDKIRSAVAPFTPERVAPACGVEADTIRRLTRAFSAAPKAVCYGRIGTCTQPFGSLANWLVDVLNALTGNLDEPGGAMFTSPAHEPRRPNRTPGGRGFKVGRWTSRVRGAPEVFGEFPVATLADEILTEGEDQVRALITVAGNPILSTPDGARLNEALGRLDFMVSVDPYLNETTRHAKVILPPPPSLSRPHYDISFYTYSLRNIANFSPPVFERAHDALPEWAIMLRLTGLFSGAGDNVEVIDDFVCRQMVEREVRDASSPLHGRDVDELVGALGDRRGPERMLDFMLRAGLYGEGFGADPDGLCLDKLLASPHGIDLGPLMPRLPEALQTPSGRLELAPPSFIEDVARLDRALNEHAEAPLTLVGRRHLRSNNSWMHNVPSLMTGRPRCTALVHPDDAQRFGVQDGQLARLSSATGEITVTIEVDPRMRPGVVSVPHGWGHDDEHTRLGVARQSAGANVNLLVSTRQIDPLSGNAVLTGVPVSLSA